MKQGDRVAVVGASGYLGGLVCDALEREGFEVVRVSRSRQGEGWKKWGEGCIEGTRVVINFAGKSIDCRWNDEVKEELRRSRIEPCEQITKWIAEMPQEQRPELVMSASGAGIFGTRGDQVLEDNTEEGEGFLARLCYDWETAARGAELYGVRVVCMRFGAVMGKESKPWRKMALPYKCFVGGKLGDGSSYFSWIHEYDAVQAMLFAMHHQELSGGVNFVAESCRHSELAKEMGRAIGRPCFFSVPSLAMKLVLGEFSEALLASLNVISAKLDTKGFCFKFKNIGAALDDLASG